MSRITGPKCRICRREGVKLFLKGTRCDTVKCPIERRGTPPGQHGQRRIRLTDYGIHLREVQKTKRFYGLTDRQFRHLFDSALRMPGNTGENLLSLLERRLDNVVYRLGIAPSRASARQIISHGHIDVNGRRVDVPSFSVKPGDVVRAHGRERDIKLVAALQQGPHRQALPSWLELSTDPAVEGRVKALPVRQEVELQIREQLIVEFYSK
jgi:small subunit ribosomal protein S4